MHPFRLLALALAVVCFTLSAPSPLFAGDLEQILVESASTPAQHEALARHFHEKAAAARKEAETHRSMAKAYGGTKLSIAAAQRKHCTDLAANLDAQAKLYDELASGHEAEAKKK
jgi:hypothetical protein